uniref:Uncharacterized protein n=1 Tax=Bubo bubo TaxID=30461 RepID=A0A8C0F9L4_BUBBB
EKDKLQAAGKLKPRSPKDSSANNYSPLTTFSCSEKHCLWNNYISFCRICVITLAEAHPLLQSGKTIKSINYQISANCSRLQNKVSGKNKLMLMMLILYTGLFNLKCIYMYVYF